MVTLRIFLIGLIALVPDFSHGKLSVILQEVRSHPNHPHYPVVVYDCRQRTGNPCWCKTPPILKCKDILHDGEHKFGSILLNGAKIEINGGEEGEMNFTGGRNHHWFHNTLGEVPEHRHEALDFSWVPSMSRVLGGARTIDPRHLYRPDPKKIAALLTIYGIEGNIETFGLVDFKGDVTTFTFKEKKGTPALWDYKQALADIVAIQIPLKTNKAELRFKNFVGGGSDSLSLKAAGRSTIDIVIGNLPPYLPRDASCEAAVADHFDLYYELALDPPQTGRELPFPGRRTSRSSKVEECLYDLPDIIRYIEGSGPCTDFEKLNLRGAAITASSNRPICTEVVFDQ